MMKYSLICAAALLAAAVPSFGATVAVTDVDTTVQANVNTLAGGLASGGVVLSNITYTGANGSAGTFTNGLPSGIGISSGIILSSGNVQNALGPNNSPNATTSFGTSGFAPLSAIAGPGFDGAVLQFDFTTTSTDLYFNYVFASEEYNEWVGSAYNDAFAFFLDGTAAANNLALIPGTATPVSVNNVNNGLNSAYYVDNTAPTFDIQYDGFTKVLTAHASGLDGLPTTIHHMTLVVEDTGDSVLDSAVFLQAGTFSGTPTPPDEAVPLPNAAYPGLLILGTLAGVSKLRRRRLA